MKLNSCMNHDSNLTENYGILTFELQLSKNSALHQIKTGNLFDKYLENVLNAAFILNKKLKRS